MNKLKSTLVFLTFAVVFTPQLFSQSPEDKKGTGEVAELIDYITRARQVDYKDYTGSPYANEDFQSGSILGENTVLVSNIYLRYNAMQDEFQVKRTLTDSDTDLQALRKSSDVYIKVGNEIFKFFSLQSNIHKGGYFNLLAEGKNYDLYKKIGKTFTPGMESVTKMTGNHPARFSDDINYYIVSESGEFTELPNSKNKRYEAIAGEKKKELKKYAKSNRLNVKKEEDLITVIEYYNSNF